MMAWLGALQSQDYPAAKWALAQRLKGASAAALERAFNQGPSCAPTSCVTLGILWR